MQYDDSAECAASDYGGLLYRENRDGLSKIPPIGLSCGIKILILVKFEPEKVFSVSTCGDNCAKEGSIMPLMAKAAATRGGVVCEKSAPGTTPAAKKAARQSPQALPGGRCLIG